MVGAVPEVPAETVGETGRVRTDAGERDGATGVVDGAAAAGGEPAGVVATGCSSPAIRAAESVPGSQSAVSPSTASRSVNTIA